MNTTRTCLAWQRGYTVIEFLVAAAIGIVLIGAMAYSVIGASITASTGDRSNEVQDSTRFAMDVITRELRHAGFLGYGSAAPIVEAIAPITNKCSDALVSNVGQAVWASDGENPFSATCIPTDRYARGDVLVIRRASNNEVTPANETDVYIRSAFEKSVVYQGKSNRPDFASLAPFFDHRLEVSVYFVGPYSYDKNENPKQPGLFRVSLTKDGMSEPVLVASGVENLAVQVGRVVNGNVRYFHPKQLSTTATADTTTSEWNEVQSVRVWLLGRSAAPEPGLVKAETFVIGNQTIKPTDQYRRTMLQATVALRNTGAP